MEYEDAIKPFNTEADFIDNENKSPIRNNIVNEDIKMLKNNLETEINNIQSSSISNNEKLDKFNELKKGYLGELNKFSINNLNDIEDTLNLKVKYISFYILKEELIDKKSKILSLENRINSIDTGELTNKDRRNLFSDIESNINTYKSEIERIDNLRDSEISLDNLKNHKEYILNTFNDINQKVVKLETLIKLPTKDKKA